MRFQRNASTSVIKLPDSSKLLAPPCEHSETMVYSQKAGFLAPPGSPPIKDTAPFDVESAALVTLPLPDSTAGLGNAHLVCELPDVVVVPPTTPYGEGNDPICIWSARAEGVVKSFLDSNPPTPLEDRARDWITLAGAYKQISDAHKNLVEFTRDSIDSGIIIMPRASVISNSSSTSSSSALEPPSSSCQSLATASATSVALSMSSEGTKTDMIAEEETPRPSMLSVFSLVSGRSGSVSSARSASAPSVAESTALSAWSKKPKSKRSFLKFSSLGRSRSKVILAEGAPITDEIADDPANGEEEPVLPVDRDPRRLTSISDPSLHNLPLPDPPHENDEEREETQLTYSNPDDDEGCSQEAVPRDLENRHSLVDLSATSMSEVGTSYAVLTTSLPPVAFSRTSSYFSTAPTAPSASGGATVAEDEHSQSVSLTSAPLIPCVPEMHDGHICGEEPPSRGPPSLPEIDFEDEETPRPLFHNSKDLTVIPIYFTPSPVPARLIPSSHTPGNVLGNDKSNSSEKDSSVSQAFTKETPESRAEAGAEPAPLPTLSHHAVVTHVEAITSTFSTRDAQTWPMVLPSSKIGTKVTVLRDPITVFESPSPLASDTETQAERSSDSSISKKTLEGSRTKPLLDAEPTEGAKLSRSKRTTDPSSRRPRHSQSHSPAPIVDEPRVGEVVTPVQNEAANATNEVIGEPNDPSSKVHAPSPASSLPVMPAPTSPIRANDENHPGKKLTRTKPANSPNAPRTFTEEIEAAAEEVMERVRREVVVLAQPSPLSLPRSPVPVSVRSPSQLSISQASITESITDSLIVTPRLVAVPPILPPLAFDPNAFASDFKSYLDFAVPSSCVSACTPLKSYIESFGLKNRCEGSALVHRSSRYTGLHGSRSSHASVRGHLHPSGRKTSRSGSKDLVTRPSPPMTAKVTKRGVIVANVPTIHNSPVVQPVEGVAIISDMRVDHARSQARHRHESLHASRGH